MIDDKRSCFECDLNTVCFAFISIEKVLNDCAFINNEEEADNYPDEISASSNDIYNVLAKTCTNYSNEDEDEPEIDENIEDVETEVDDDK